MLPDPISSLPKTLVFLDCIITEDLMARLARFASEREGITLAPPDRVTIHNSSGGSLPSAASIGLLRKHVAVVEVIEGRDFPKDLLPRDLL